MSAGELNPQVPNEKLSEAMPDPSGPPQPVDEDLNRGLNSIAALGVGLVALGGILLPMFASTFACRGATRSAKVQWETRQQQIEEARVADRSATAVPVAPAASEGSTDERAGN